VEVLVDALQSDNKMSKPPTKTMSKPQTKTMSKQQTKIKARTLPPKEVQMA